MTRISAFTDRFSTLAGGYDAVLSDVWGVIHNGVAATPAACEALMQVAKARGKAPVHNRVIAIGDSIRTDLTGAGKYGLDCLFVTAGIHAEELGHRDAPDLSALNRMFADAGIAPRAVMSRLAW